MTLGECSYPLPNPFLVLATQNPIEQEGTYQLPEAQLDRFLFKVVVDYPSRDEELKVLLTDSSRPILVCVDENRQVRIQFMGVTSGVNAAYN